MTSIEVRRSFEDPNGTTARAARTQSRDALVEGERVDRYLVTSRHNTGLKPRAEANDPTHVHGGVVGEIERWRKLSLALGDPKLEKGRDVDPNREDAKAPKYRQENGRVLLVADTENDRPAAGSGAGLTSLVID